MTDVNVSVTVGEKLPLTVSPTAVDVQLYSGEGYLSGWSLRDAQADTDLANTGIVVAPGAGVTIATVTGVAAGTYAVNWTVGLQGAAAAGDANNFTLVDTAGTVLGSINPGAAGEYPQPTVDVTLAAGNSVSIKAIGAGTAGVTYSASLTLVPNGVIEMVVELQDGARILGEASASDLSTDTVTLGDPGVSLRNGVLLHVVSGKVTGTVYVTMDQYYG